MKLIMSLFVFSLVVACNAKADQLLAPDALKYVESGSCQANNLEFSALSFFPTKSSDGSNFNLVVYLMDDGKAAISYRNYENVTGGSQNDLANEFIQTSWQASGKGVFVEKLGKISYFKGLGDEPYIFLVIDNTYFTKLNRETASGGRSSSDLNNTGESYEQVCR